MTVTESGSAVTDVFLFSFLSPERRFEENSFILWRADTSVYVKMARFRGVELLLLVSFASNGVF